jgi:alkyldihydroxyacetonephosphate synthase
MVTPMHSALREGRSHWAWGAADQLPAPAARRMVGAQVAALLGVPTPEVAEAVAEGAANVRPSCLQVPESLAEFCTADRGVRLRRTWGRSFLDQYRAFHGDFTAAPDLVARPRSEAELCAVLAHARAEGWVVVPWGGGTSVVGGVTCAAHQRRAGVVVVDLGGFDRLLALDAHSGLAHLEAGMLGPQVEAALAPHGFTLRHFPQSFEFSTLGGWLATRAGGHFATVYTHIDDLTAGLRMVTGAGEVWESRPLPGSGAGPAPDRWLLGSEGALGIITQAWMRVRRRPRSKGSAGVHFASFEAGVEAARRVAQAGLFPSNCRLLDPTEARLNFVSQGSAVLLLGFEAADHSVEASLSQAVAIAQAAGGHLPRPPTHQEAGARDASAESWRQAFLSGPYLQSSLISLGILADTFETACTWAAFPGLDAAVRAAVRDAAAGPVVVSCRFTHVYPDGPAPYYTFLTPMAADVPAQWHRIKAAASEVLMAHGATTTHHHAVGRVHRPWYDQERPAPFAAALRAARAVVDPAGIMNPGVLVD